MTIKGTKKVAFSVTYIGAAGERNAPTKPAKSAARSTLARQVTRNR